MKATINSSLLTKLKPDDKPYDVRDDKLTGFLVRVNISGKLLYMCEYARGKRITIGRTDVLTPTQARDRAMSILGDAAKGIDPGKKNTKIDHLTLLQFLDDHYKPWVTEHRRVGHQTLAQLKRCFGDLFGDKPLTEITPVLVDQWRTQRLKKGSKAETANRDIAILKAALSKAVLWGLLTKNPLNKLKMLKTDRSIKVRFLSTEEEKRLRDAAVLRENKVKAEREHANQWRSERGYDLFPDMKQLTFVDHMRPMILLSINTGLRRGEVFSLRWENIDLERATLTIEGADAKSGKTRHVPLNTEALHVLKIWKKQTGNVGLVFANRDGQRFDNIKKAWLGILRAAKIENFRWHDLRHHFASRLVMAGVDLNTVRELLGHTDMSMTLRYAHLAPEHKANAVEKLVNSSSFKRTTLTEKESDNP
ncbi:MAG: hypothetical protein A3F11_05035 [Gammaproteobacteria bacterium RIFCSPHIGHO2_12_FULL_37_14]|nr:MAG: hypothetical protein A3F11_05035 [Gammaproteobacteria bacterium RIFCSPHIGHO2_12_FULL_37_14]